MDRSKVTSSQIESIGYRADTGSLEVEFKGGSTYQYENVDAKTFNELMAAESIGSFFIHNIKKKPEIFPYKKIEVVNHEHH